MRSSSDGVIELRGVKRNSQLVTKRMHSPPSCRQTPSGKARCPLTGGYKCGVSMQKSPEPWAICQCTLVGGAHKGRFDSTSLITTQFYFQDETYSRSESSSFSYFQTIPSEQRRKTEYHNCEARQGKSISSFPFSYSWSFHLLTGKQNPWLKYKDEMVLQVTLLQHTGFVQSQ